MRRIKNGLKTIVEVQLTGFEFMLIVTGRNGQAVKVIFSNNGTTIIRADDSAKLERG